jgi:hypothetical protein
MWKSFFDRPTQPKQYVHPLQPMQRTRYALDVHRSHRSQWVHPMHPLECVLWEHSLQSTQLVQ